MINLSQTEFSKQVNYPAINKDSDGAFTAALLEAQRNYLLPIIGRELLAAIIDFSKLEVYAWSEGTQSEVGRVYQYQGYYFKALVSVTSAPVAGDNWAVSQMGFLYKEFVEPYMCYSIYYNLLIRSNVTLKGNNALRSNVSYEQGTENTDLQRNINHYKDLRDNQSGYLTSQLSRWGWKIDGNQYESIGSVNFTRCLNNGTQCGCTTTCRNNNQFNSRRSITII